MKKIIVNILFVFACIIANAQQVTFSKVLWDVPQSGIGASALIPTTSKGYLLVGGGLVIKIDSAANPIWNKAVGSNAMFNDVSSTNDSCYILVGNIYNSTTSRKDAFCVKINASGNVLWARQLGSSNNIDLYSVQQTKDLGYIMSGYVNSSNTPNSQVFVAKLNSAGNLQWSNLLTVGNYRNESYSIRACSRSFQ